MILGITLALGCNLLMIDGINTAYAAQEFSTYITGNADVDSEYTANNVIDADTGKYVFSDDTVISTSFKQASGWGRVYYGTITNYDSNMTNSNGVGNTYIDLQGNDLTVNTDVSLGRTYPMCYSAGIYAVKEGVVQIDNPGAITITNNADYYYAAGIKAGSAAKGQLAQVIINNDNSEEHKVTIRGGMKGGGIWDINFWGIYTNNDNEVYIKGLADIETNNAVNLWAKSGLIDIGGGYFVANNYDAMQITDGGNININVKTDADGNVTAGNNKVVVNGGIVTTTGYYGTGAGGTINVAFTTDESEFVGRVRNPETANSTVNLWLQNGALWNNTGESTVDNLYGSADKRNTGVIYQNEAASLTFENYSGNTLVIYEHDEQDPTGLIGGDVTIQKAAAGSAITLSTDNVGINIHDYNEVGGVLNALANKLYYSEAVDGAENLEGTVQIAEGLLTSSAALKVGAVSYDAANAGQGGLVEGSISTPDPEIIYGDSETAMMSGAKSAMASTAMIWRAENDDMMKRLGEVRNGNGEAGIWAKYYTGKVEMDAQKANFESEYNAYQIGYDKELDSGWLLGTAFSYNDGESEYNMGGSGDISVASLSAYGTRKLDDGRYIDLVAKVSRLDNDYTVYNDMRHKLQGDYDTWGVSFSAEYGKRFERKNGFYIDPSVQLTIGHIDGKSYTAASDFLDVNGKYKDVSVLQESMHSVVGKLGVGVGQKTEKANYFAKVALAHEFCGDFGTSFQADGEADGRTNVDFGGTWCELELGAGVQLNDKTMLYATYERSFGGDVEEKYRIDAGMRFSF